MKTFTNTLNSFIAAFNLVRQDGVICFDATIYFSSNTHFIQIPSEVQILKIDKGEAVIEVIYLLSSDVDRLFIPNIFEAGKEQFQYLKGTALVIKGHSPIQGGYVLSIHPIGDCNAATGAIVSHYLYCILAGLRKFLN